MIIFYRKPYSEAYIPRCTNSRKKSYVFEKYQGKFSISNKQNLCFFYNHPGEGSWAGKLLRMQCTSVWSPTTSKNHSFSCQINVLPCQNLVFAVRTWKWQMTSLPRVGFLCVRSRFSRFGAEFDGEFGGGADRVWTSPPVSERFPTPTARFRGEIVRRDFLSPCTMPLNLYKQ